MPEPQQMCTFSVAGQLFGVELARVQEIVRYQPLTHLPLAPPQVAGLLNLRGQIVPAIDLRHRLGLPARDSGVLPTNVVLRDEESPVSLLVDDIGDILPVSSGTFEPPPDHLRGPLRELLLGVYKLRHQLLLVLSVDAALELPLSTPE